MLNIFFTVSTWLVLGSVLVWDTVCVANTLEEEPSFECVQSNGKFRPKALNGYPYPLGSSAMTEEECGLALKYHRNNVICSYTGIGWKPTVGAKNPQRPHGHSYVGGSSMQGSEGFKACLKATLNSSEKEVCAFGNDWSSNAGKKHWFIGTTDGTFKSRGFPIIDLDTCLKKIHGVDFIPTDL